MPPQQRIGAHDGHQLSQEPASDGLRSDGEATALVIVESESTTGRQPDPKDTIFLFEVFDDGLLLAVDPTGNREQKELEQRWFHQADDMRSE